MLSRFDEVDVKKCHSAKIESFKILWKLKKITWSDQIRLYYGVRNAFLAISIVSSTSYNLLLAPWPSVRRSPKCKWREPFLKNSYLETGSQNSTLLALVVEGSLFDFTHKIIYRNLLVTSLQPFSQTWFKTYNLPCKTFSFENFLLDRSYL